MNTKPRQTGRGGPRGTKNLPPAPDNKENIDTQILRLEQLEQKFNVEGSNTLDIVYARQENDQHHATIQAQAAELERLKEIVASFHASEGALGPNITPSGSAAAGSTQDAPKKDKARKHSAAANVDDMALDERASKGQIGAESQPSGKKGKAPKPSAPTNVDDMAIDAPDGAAAVAGTGADDEGVSDTTAALARENAELKRLLAAAQAGPVGGPAEEGPAPGSIPRPKGSAGSDFNIQDAMGLGHGRKNRKNYKSIMRSCRDLVLQARIDWERPWAEVSAATKSKAFAVAEERHPILARFFNSWATEELMKQSVKNKRNRAYKHDGLEVPEKYAYLKANAAKRNPTAPRGRQAKLGRVDVARKRAEKKKKVATSSIKTKKDAKGKGKAVAPESDEDDVEMKQYAPSEEDESDCTY
ncbi:hypothetical protein C8F04DRAFT_1200920 [Mycena alexandri]|uniref:Uncharacterized protein n=1 Tax=Mycena alexandri TaxID=1745969 RepID=A0AAD6RYU6_9AGAR|nr:hypothetical protein C8F04DRAFT_1200920 [Mycena alexandri]